MGGEYPGTFQPGHVPSRVAGHIGAGITFFLDLTEEGELDSYAEHLPASHPASGIPVLHKRMPIRDVDVPRSPAEMIAILDVIDAALEQGHLVYIHCWGGVGRTGTVVGCYFVRRGSTGQEALVKLAELWRTVEKSKRKPVSPETELQRAFVVNWSESDKGNH